MPLSVAPVYNEALQRKTPPLLPHEVHIPHFLRTLPIWYPHGSQSPAALHKGNKSLTRYFQKRQNDSPLSRPHRFPMVPVRTLSLIHILSVIQILRISFCRHLCCQSRQRMPRPQNREAHRTLWEHQHIHCSNQYQKQYDRKPELSCLYRMYLLSFFHPLHRHIYLSPAFILQQNRTKNPKLFLKDSLHISLQFIILGGHT